MKWRIIALAAVLVGGFFYLTSRDTGLFQSSQPRNGPSFWAGPAVTHSAGPSSDEQNNIDVYKAAREATVNITSTVLRRDFFFQIYGARESGSGFVIGKDGLIVTNNHVVSGSRGIQVTLADRSRHEATIVDRDVPNDLALIKIEGVSDLPTLLLGDSERLQVGQKVLAIGNPFGLEGTLTTGIISSIGRDIADESGRVLEGMIQTDAAINPGNSGGPLLDSNGTVIGVNTAIYGPGGNIGIGFALPVNRLRALLDAYGSGKPLVRPLLGITGILVSGNFAEALDLPAEGGLLIDQVARGSPTASAGLRGAKRYIVVRLNEIGIGGDLIMEIDGRKVEQQDTITRVMAQKTVGDSVELLIFREGRRMRVKVPLAGSEAL